MTKPVSDSAMNTSMASPQIQLFQRLGDEIESAWMEKDYDEEVFPSLAAGALRNADIPSKITAWDAVRWTLEQKELPQQADLNARFGDPPITLFKSPRFFIDIYFWFQGTTAVHQHSFCGAFQVFQGSSIHSCYEFDLKDKVNSFMEFGEMSLRKCELLEAGDVQEIVHGRRYIHSLFHLDQPSVTIVVRTDKSPLELPQYSYHKPTLALDPFFEHPTTVKKLQAIAAMARSKHPDTDRLIIELLGRSDLHTSYMVLSSANAWLKSDRLGKMFNDNEPQERFDAMLKAAEAKHGDRGKHFRAVFDYSDRQEDIVRRRSYITNSEHRFYFALLMNLDSRQAILSLVKQRFPEADPIEKILDWTFDLSETRLFGISGSNALGISEFDNLDMFVFEGLLKAQTASEIREELQNQNIDSVTNEQLPDRIRKLRDAAIFKPLFQ